MMMHQAKVVLTGLIIYSSLFCYGQKEVKTYYDRAKKRVEEHYFVSNENQAMEGKYKRYFPNGKLALEGTFVNVDSLLHQPFVFETDISVNLFLANVIRRASGQIFLVCREPPSSIFTSL